VGYNYYNTKATGEANFTTQKSDLQRLNVVQSNLHKQKLDLKK
jgi:hypothetical protein